MNYSRSADRSRKQLNVNRQGTESPARLVRRHWRLGLVGLYHVTNLNCLWASGCRFLSFKCSLNECRRTRAMTMRSTRLSIHAYHNIETSQWFDRLVCGRHWTRSGFWSFFLTKKQVGAITVIFYNALLILTGTILFIYLQWRSIHPMFWIRYILYMINLFYAHCLAGYFYHRLKSREGNDCKPRLSSKVIHRYCKEPPCRSIKDCTNPKHSCVCDEDCGRFCVDPSKSVFLQ